MNTIVEQGEAVATNGEQETKQKVKHAKSKESDILVLMVQEISALDAEQAIAAVPALLDGADENYFRLGGVFSAIITNKFFTAAGHETFKEFVEQTYSIQYRKAMYWVSIYNSLIESGVPWNKVKDVGWTKLKDLASILTLENVDEWVNRAANSTVLQLQEAIAKHKTGVLPNSGITPEDDKKSQVTTYTCKVHEDQKTVIKEAVEKARAEAGTDFDGVALEAICMNYLSGGNVNKPNNLSEILLKYSLEEVLTTMETAFPNANITVKMTNKKTA